MRTPFLVLSLLLAASPALAEGAPAGTAPAVRETGHAQSNTGSAPDLPPTVKEGGPADGRARAADDRDGEDEDEGPSAPPGPLLVAALQGFSSYLHWTGGALVGISAANLILREADGADDRRTVSLATAYAAGPFLAGWGAHWVGAYNDRPGSYWAAVGGAAAGEALGFGATRLLDRPSRLQEFLFPALLAAAGATAGSVVTADVVADTAGPGTATPAVTGSLSVAPGGAGLALTLAGSF